MPAFFLTLVAVFLAATGARDQRLVAELSHKLGGSSALLVAGWASAIATAAIAASFGEAFALLLPPAAKTMFVAFALLLAAAELAWPIRQREIVEPTQSLFAITAVIAARQLGDGARFLIVAIAAAHGAPWLAGAGGALGGGAALTLGWALGHEQLAGRIPLRQIRLGIAALLLFAAIWAGLTARGIL